MERARLQARLLLMALPCWGACNAVLGIEEPRSAAADTASDPALVDAGGGDPSDGEGNAGDPSSRPSPSPHAWAEWPMPDSTSQESAGVQSYRFDADGIVTDSVTGLEWQQSVDEKRRSWQGARDYCEGLSLGGGGFRLPARIELISLLDIDRVGSNIDEGAFPDAPPDSFWSASPVAGAAENAWLINFQFSTRYAAHAEIAEEHRVRCVR